MPRTAAGGKFFFGGHFKERQARHTRVNVRCARLECCVCVGDGHAGVVMQMNFDIAADNAAEGANEFVNLARVCATNGVGDADPVDADLVHGLVDGKEVHEIGAEGILCREADLDALRLDKVDHLDSGLGDVSHVLAMRKFTEEGGCADDDINAVDAGLDGDARVVHVATDVGEDFGLQAELADGLAVPSRLLGSCRRREFEILDAELVEGFGDGDLGFCVKEGISKLLPLCGKSCEQCEGSAWDDIGRNLGECSQ